MNKLIKTIMCFVFAVSIFSGTISVNAKSFDMKVHGFEWVTDENGIIKKVWDDGVETGPSSSLPIGQYEGKWAKGAIYDFAQYDDQSNIVEYGIKNEGEYLWSPDRTTLVTHRITNPLTNSTIYPLHFISNGIVKYADPRGKKELRYQGQILNNYARLNKEKVTKESLIDLSQSQKQKINNILRLGYVELNGNQKNEGTGTAMMAPLDAMLATQFSLYKALDNDFNLNYSGANYDNAGKNAVMTNITEWINQSSENTRTSKYLEASVNNMNMMSDDDLKVKIIPTNKVEKKDGYYIQTFKVSVPLKHNLDIWNIKESSQNEHLIFAKSKISLKENVVGAVVEINPVEYKGNFKENWVNNGIIEEPKEISSTKHISVKQGDLITLKIPEKTIINDNIKKVELVSNAISKGYDFDIKNINFDLSVIEQESDNNGISDGITRLKKEFLEKNKEGFKFLNINDTYDILDNDQVNIEFSKVNVKYVDTNKKELAKSITLVGAVDEKYQTQAIEIDGYKLKKQPTNANGVFAKAEVEVTYIYEKIKQPQTGGVIENNNDDKGTKNPNNLSSTNNKKNKVEGVTKVTSAIPKTGSFYLTVTSLLAITAMIIYRIKNRKI